LKNKNKVTEGVTGSGSLKATRLTLIREGAISDMRNLLITWIEDHTQKRIPLSSMTITTKRKRFLMILKENAGHYYDVEFTVSSGCFKLFMNLYSLHSEKVCGQSAGADAKEPEEFLETADRLILPVQIFNVNETFLLRKWMPERTFIHKEAKSMPGFKAFKDRISLLLGSNVAGAN
jgi:hypothetical protein